MEVKSYYVDSCIYLNLWKKEERDGVSYWKLAKEFLNKIENRGLIIYYSGYLLKELSYRLDKETFNKKLEMFNYSSRFERTGLSVDEFNEASRIESEIDYEISFYDILHMLLAKKTNSVLITRDKKLIEVCKRYSVVAKMPEEIL